MNAGNRKFTLGIIYLIGNQVILAGALILLGKESAAVISAIAASMATQATGLGVLVWGYNREWEHRSKESK